MGVVAAGAWVHGGQEHNPGRVGGGARGTGDGYFSCLQGLAEGLQYVPIKFRQFIQEQHPVVGKADFSRLGESAPAYQACLADAVMWRAEGAWGHQACAWGGGGSP